MERGALFWAQGLANISTDGLKNFYDSVSGRIALPERTIRLPGSALHFLRRMIQADDQYLLEVCSARLNHSAYLF
jgi:hypothetical protein